MAVDCPEVFDCDGFWLTPLAAALLNVAIGYGYLVTEVAIGWGYLVADDV